MSTTPPHPTLWRTCRALANIRRLKLFAQLARMQPQCVSELAARNSLTLPVTSQALRALESRGLLHVSRSRRRVEYRLPAQTEASNLAELVGALQTAFRYGERSVGRIFKLATAFTHPTRIEIHRALKSGPKTGAQLASVFRISRMALWRNLQKLTARGFIRYDSRRRLYRIVAHDDRIGRALSRLAI
jgi:DNA-binding transcriptional ArsR family regulator/biotin operon repressor